MISIGLFLFISQVCVAANDEKGTLPEVRLDSKNEDKNQETAFKSEVLITKAENKAIEALIKIIKKKKGSSEEPDLLFRLAELYMRRAKSGRFFEMYDKAEKRLNQTGIQSQKSQQALKNAIVVYNRIENNYPKYKDLDAVYFNNAMAHQQTRQIERAKTLYNNLVAQFPKSPLVPDALLENGELYYNQQQFSEALKRFVAIEKYPNSKAYPYGLYKSAWAYYNLKQTDAGVKQLLTVVEKNPADSKDSKKYNLRKEALRDLTLFVGETLPPEKLYSFFDKICTEEELGDAMMALSSLYESHSRYSEINIFVRQFIDKHPESPFAAKSYAKLIENNETLKKRDTVIDYMKKMGDFCASNPTNKECGTEFRRVQLDVSKKWWEIWLKNKKNTEFSKLTEQAFEVLLKNDDPQNPDTKSRYAYAELLFQQGKFDQASQNYEEVSNAKGVDKNLQHDALYGALYSLEKLLDKKDDPVQVERQKTLATRYITQFPNGEHVVGLQFKLGFIAYKQQDYDNALKLLQPLTKKSKFAEIQSKSEDIILDIYNIRKDYKSIQAFSKQVASGSKSGARKTAMNKINEEAHYAQMQEEATHLTADKQIDQLRDFAKEHPKTKLGKDSFWQAISLAYSKGFDVLGADMSLEFTKEYPDDPRGKDSIKDATKAYIDAGQLSKAIGTLRELAKTDKKDGLKHLETSCDLLRVNGQIPESRGCYKGLLDSVGKAKRVELISKIIKSYRDSKGSSELISLENQILGENIEPYATQLLIEKANKLFDSGKITEAFNASLKINARNVDADLRAEARLLQAKVLEKEFVAQSVKARMDKFATVLNLKTEKMDKAFTAYSTTLKMSKTAKVQTEALQGIDRLYSHFIESISNMPIPNSLNADEQKELRGQLVKLTDPFKKKREDNLAQLRKVSSLSTGNSEEIVWADLNPEKTAEPRVKFPAPQKLALFLPNKLDLNDAAKISLNEKKCTPNTVTALNMAGCIQSGKFAEAEKLAFMLTANKDNRPIGLYYLSAIADKQNHPDKALWLVDKALTTNPESSMANYQKGKVLYSVEGINSALPYFEKVLDMKKTSQDLVVMSALKSFSDRDYITATEEFSRLSTEDLYNYQLGTLYVEATAQKGETEQAIKMATNFLKGKLESVDMWIEQARVYEMFAMNKDNALSSYQKALAKSTNIDQKDWLKKKIDFLKTNKVSQITSNVSGD